MSADKIVNHYFIEQKLNRITFPFIGIAFLLLFKGIGIPCAIVCYVIYNIIFHYQAYKAFTGILNDDCDAKKYWEVFSALYGKSNRKKQKQRYYIHIIRGLYAMGKLEDMEQEMDAYEEKDELSPKNKISFYLYRIYLNSEIHPQENQKLIKEFQEFLDSFKYRKCLKKRGEDALDTWLLLERVKQNPSQKDLKLLEKKKRKKKSICELRFFMDYLGRGYLKLGDREKAKNYLGQVAGLDSDLAFVHKARILYQKEFGEMVKFVSFRNEKRLDRERSIRWKQILICLCVCYMLYKMSYYSYNFLTSVMRQPGEDTTQIRTEQKEKEKNKTQYYDSIQEALKYDEGRYTEQAEPYMRTIDEIFLKREKKTDVTMFYNAESKKSGENCLIMAEFKIKKKNGIKKYKIIRFDCNYMLRDPDNDLLKISSGTIQAQMFIVSEWQKMSGMQNQISPLWSVCSSKRIYQLRINGKAPDSIVTICKYGGTFYLWYYEDVGDISDLSKVKVELVEPDETKP